MYESFYELQERPFDLTPNPRFLFLTQRHREALVSLEYGIARRKGVVVLIGEAGMGKTTLVRAAIDNQRQSKVKCVYLNNPLLTRTEFLQFLGHSFSLSRDAETSKTNLINELAPRLETLQRRGKTVALLVDEAQSLPDELLEEIRLLTNIETNDDKLMTLILAGQPELGERLNNQALRQLKQRIELRCTLEPFDLPETAAYIASRLSTAGAELAPFTREAVAVIHQRSRGIPRSISVICENALVSGFAEQERPVTSRLVTEVCDEFDLTALLPEVAAQENGSPAAPEVPANQEPLEVDEPLKRRLPAR
jgi:type II secretory pathway predicted ATPase ExeA